MTLTRKDVTATLLTALSVAVFAATHEGWSVWLVGDSRRWAAGAIFALGALACAQGSRDDGVAAKICGALGALALGLAVVAVATGSLTPLSLLVADIVLLWAVSTARHAAGRPHAPSPT